MSAAASALVTTEIEEYLARLTSVARAEAPRQCCPHAPQPCLSCALNWLVAQRVPVNLDPDYRPQRALSELQ